MALLLVFSCLGGLGKQRLRGLRHGDSWKVRVPECSKSFSPSPFEAFSGAVDVEVRVGRAGSRHVAPGGGPALVMSGA